nr:signal peptidase I [Lentibacillus jeotgali]
MKKILNVINHITTFLLFAVLIVTVLLVISFRASGGEAAIFGYQFKTVLSGSMEPEIQTGSIISIEKGGDMKRFEKGDVITYRTPEDMLVTHRIAEVIGDGEQYITKGDNNEGADLDPILAQNVVGKYTGFTVPYIGYVMNFANTSQGAALMLILPGLLLVGYSGITIWRALRQFDDSKAAEKH